MRSLATSLLIVALAGAVCAQAPSANTVISDTITSPSGPNPSGNIIISWGQYQNDAVPRKIIFPGSITVSVVNGVVNVSLFPNAAALPVSGCYNVAYRLNSFNLTRYWYVPISPVPVTISEVEGQIPCATSSGALIAPGQIAGAGATTGQALIWNGFFWAPGNGGGGGGGNPGGINGQVQFNNLGAFGGFTPGGDVTLVRPNFIVNSTNGVPFSPSATINALNATNINSGILATTFGGTGASSLSAAGIGLRSDPLSQFASTTSAQLFGVISDASGTGQLVFNNSPSLVNPALGTPASGIGTNLTGIPLGTAVIGVLPPQFGGTGISNMSTLTLGTSNQNWFTLGTGIVKNTTGTGALSNAVSSDVFGLWAGFCNSVTFLRGDGQCATPAGAGTVTHTAGPLTLNAVIIGNGAADVAALNSLGTLGYVLTSTGASTPPTWQPAASSSGGYNFCASGCSATVPASGTTIAAATHLQGVSAWAMAADSSGHEMTSPNFLVTRDSSGDLTFTYVTAPSYIAIMGAGSGGGGGGSGVGWSANGSLIGTSSLSNFTSSSGITLTGTFPSSVFTLNVAPDTTVLQTKANLQTGTAPTVLVSASGSPTTYTASTTPALASYAANSTFRWTIDTTSTCTSACSLNVNALGAKTVSDYLGNSLVVGALSGGSTYTITYNGTKFLCAECGIISSVPTTGSQTQYLQVTPNTGNTTTYQWNGTQTANPSDYNYSVTPTSPSTLTAGSRTITLAICPLGIFAGSTWAPVYLTAGSGGTAEATTPTGGTCSAATLGIGGGTVIVTISNTHGAGYLVQSATAGCGEAVNSGAKNVFFPAGTSTLRAACTVTTTGVTFSGTGFSSVIQAASGAALQSLIVTTNTATGFKINNLTVDGNRTALGTAQNVGSNQYALILLQAADAEVRNCQIQFGQATGISIGDNSLPANRVSILQNYIHDNGGTINSSGWGTGVYIGFGSVIPSGTTVSENHLENNYNTVTSPGPSAAISAATASDVVISNNYAKNNYNISGGQVAAGTSGTTSCAGLSQNWTITGNTVILTGSFGGNSTSGIEICATYVSVTGNTVSSNNQGGIILDAGVANVSVTGNTVLNSGSMVTVAAITSAHASGIVVSGNRGVGGLFGFVGTNFIDDLTVIGNDVTGNTTPLSDSSTSSTVRISNNAGYNPVGTTASISPGGSPFTYTAGHSPEQIYVLGGTVTHVSKNSTDVCTSTPCFVSLYPNQSVTVTYGSVPTMTKDIQ